MSQSIKKSQTWKNECIEILNAIQTALTREEFLTISGLGQEIERPRNLVQGFVKALVALGLLDVRFAGNAAMVRITPEGKDLKVSPLQEEV